MRVFRRIMLSGGSDIDSIPETQKIYYTATTKIEPLTGSLGSRVLANQYNASTNEGVIVTAENIVAVGKDAFYGNTEVTSIKFPKTVKLIGERAFAETTNLKELWLSTGNAEFKSDAFLNTGITKVYSIEVQPTEYSGSVLNMMATNKCENANASPFYSQRAELHIPTGLVTGGNIYNNIESYSLAGIRSLNGAILLTTESTNSSSNIHIGEGAFMHSLSDLDLNISNQLEGVTIGSTAFKNCTIKNFDGMSSIIELGEQSFQESDILTSSSDPCEISTDIIPDSTFYKARMNRVIINNVRNILFSAFDGSFINELYLNGNEILCKRYAFNDCTIGKLNLNATFNTNTSNSCIQGSIINELYISPTIDHIQKDCFSTCKFTMDSLELPSTITSIEEDAFYATTATKIIIPDTVTTISKNAFSYSNISYIKIGKGITTLKDTPFYNCKTNCYDFTNHASIPSIATAYEFNNIISSCKIVVPDVLYNEWIAATNWSYLADHIIKKSDWDASQTE